MNKIIEADFLPREINGKEWSQYPRASISCQARQHS